MAIIIPYRQNNIYLKLSNLSVIISNSTALQKHKALRSRETFHDRQSYPKMHKQCDVRNQVYLCWPVKDMTE